MNRHRRRAAAAKARRTGYQHRLVAALNTLNLTPGEVSHVFVEHDAGCTFETTGCTCTPDISLRSGGVRQIIGEAGEVDESLLQ